MRAGSREATGRRAGSSLDVVREVLGLVPDDHVGPSGGALGLVGRPEHPRFLLPVDDRAAALASCLAYQGLRTPRTRFNRLAVAAAVRAGAGRRVAPVRFRPDRSPGSLLHLLGELLDQDGLEVAVGLGTRHETWRPTLQLFAPGGEPLAYAKVGPGALPGSLVDAEATALDAWARVEDPRLVVPDLIAHTSWKGDPVMVVAPLPADARLLPAGDVPGSWPVRTLDPPLPDRPLSAAPWWTDRRREFADDPEVDEVLARVEARHDGPDRAWARWHGDWVPWNLARSRRGLVVWDWEYSEPGAPVGLDDVHSAYQRVRLGRATVPDALAVAAAAAPDRWIADAHLAMLVTRAARQARLAGRPVADHHDVLAGVRAALAHRT